VGGGGGVHKLHLPIDDLWLVSLAVSLVGLKACDVKYSPKNIKKD